MQYYDLPEIRCICVQPKKQHNCKVVSESTGLNNGHSLKKRNLFRKHSFLRSFAEVSSSLHSFVHLFKKSKLSRID